MFSRIGNSFVLKFGCLICLQTSAVWLCFRCELIVCREFQSVIVYLPNQVIIKLNWRRYILQALIARLADFGGVVWNIIRFLCLCLAVERRIYQSAHDLINSVCSKSIVFAPLSTACLPKEARISIQRTPGRLTYHLHLPWLFVQTFQQITDGLAPSPPRYYY